MDEQKWIKSILAGDTKSFSCLVAKYQQMAFTIAFRILENREEAEEVVQDAFVDLWEKRADFRGEYAVKAYLYKAVRNDCLNLMRHQQVEDKYAKRVVTEGEDSESFLDRILESEIFQTLSDVFNELPPACKEVYQMSLDGKSHEEIAQTLNISVNTVKKHKNNANHYMRERLKNVLSILAWIS